MTCAQVARSSRTPTRRTLTSEDILQALRLRALRGCELGFTEAEVANLIGVSRETVNYSAATSEKAWAYLLGLHDAIDEPKTLGGFAAAYTFSRS